MPETEECDHELRPMHDGSHVVRRCQCGARKMAPAGREENDAYGRGQYLTAQLCRKLPAEDHKLVAELIATVRREWELKVTRELKA